MLQTVFLRLVKGQEDYDWSRNPEAYLSRAAINASLDLLRSRNRSKSVALDEGEVDSIAGTYESPEKVHADRELQTLVREAVSRLGKTAGEMFVLRYYEGFDNKDIATIMNTSPLVVGVVLHRARESDPASSVIRVRRVTISHAEAIELATRRVECVAGAAFGVRHRLQKPRARGYCVKPLSMIRPASCGGKQRMYSPPNTLPD